MFFDPQIWQAIQNGTDTVTYLQANPAIGIGIAMAVSAFANWLANRKKKQQQEEQETSTDESSTTTPFYSPLHQRGINAALNAYLNRLNNPADLRGYELSGLRNINDNSAIRQKTVGNLMASRGLSYSPAGFNPMIGEETRRIGEMTNFENQLPLLRRQFQTEDLSGLGTLVAGLRSGLATTGTRNASGLSTTTGGSNAEGAAAGAQSAASILAYYYGRK